jgi:hypothetical protein
MEATAIVKNQSNPKYNVRKCLDSDRSRSLKIQKPLYVSAFVYKSLNEFCNSYNLNQRE